MTEPTAEAVAATGVKKGGGLVVAFGVLMIILGIMAIGSPYLMAAVAVMWIGVAVLISGVFELIGAFQADGWKAGMFAFLGGALSILAGCVLMARPALGAALFAILLTAYLVVDGIAKVILSFQLKPIPGWGWTLFSGVVTLLLGILIWKHWPLSAPWVIGTLVGINILFKGWAMVAIGIAARTLAKEVIAEEGRQGPR